MKKGFCKRIISMIVAICMILTICPVSALAGNEGDLSTITAGKLVAGVYSDLSQAEKDLIGSGLLADVTYEYYVPGEDDGLIQVDTENKTVLAKSWTDAENGHVWNPVNADIIANGSPVESVTPDGIDTYGYDGNAFSVKVIYEMYISVDTAVQARMLNTAGWLKGGVANLDTIAEQSTNMGVVELAMPQLLELRDLSISLGNGTVKLGDDGKAAITAMNNQMTAHDGKLTLNAMVADYRDGSKTEYLLNKGSEMQPELTELTGYVSALAEALNILNNNVSTFVQFGFVDAATGEMISLLTEKVNALKAGLESAAGGDWTAAGMGTALVKAGINDVEYGTLDTLVAALGEVKSAADFTITESIRAAQTTVQHNLSMKNITVQVKLEVVEDAVDSDELVSGGASEHFVLTLEENATKAEMEAALAALTVEDEAIAAWGNTYVAEHYVRHTTELPEILTGDIAYTITYRPAIYTITYDYDEGTATKDVPYGYRTMLEVCTASGKVYDYTVNGAYHPQGSVYTVLGDVTVTRQTGKPYTTTDLYTTIAGMDGVADKEKAILTAGALLGNTEVINVRYPDTDAGSLVAIDSNLVLTGKTYASDYKGLVWAPYNYVVTAGDGTDAAPAAFTRNGDTYTAQITDSTYQVIAEGAWVTGTIGGEYTTSDGTAVNNWNFRVPTDANGYQDGNWQLTQLKLWDVYGKDGNAYTEEEPLLLDVPADNATKVVSRIVPSFAEGQSRNFGKDAGGTVTAVFMDSHTISGLYVDIKDVQGEALVDPEGNLLVSDVTLIFTYVNGSSSANGGYTSDGLTNATDGAIITVPLTNDGSNTRFVQTTDASILYAGNYTTTFSFKVSGTTYTYTGSKDTDTTKALPANAPVFSVWSKAPTLTITGITPSGSNATKITYTTKSLSWGRGTEPTFTAGMSMTSSYSNYAATLYAVATADNSTQRHGGFTRPTLTVTVAGAADGYKASFTLPAGSADAVVFSRTGNGTIKQTLGKVSQIKSWTSNFILTHTLSAYYGHGEQTISTMTLTKDGVTYTVTLTNPLKINNPSSVNQS